MNTTIETTTGAGTGLRERAAAAAAEWAAGQTEAARFTLEREGEQACELLTRLLQKRLDAEPDRFTGEGRQVRATVGGLQFEACDHYQHPDLRLVGICPGCGQETVSDDVGSLVKLGHLLERFEPIYFHGEECFAAQMAKLRTEGTPAAAPYPAGEPTTAASLLFLLRELVREELAAREE